MAPKSRYKKKSESTPSEDAREKDRLISELKDRIAVLENELRLKRECAPFSEAAERKQAEEALQLTQFALDNFLDSAIWVTKEGSIAYVNRAACNTLGYSREELLSMHISDIDPNYAPEQFRELWPEKLQGRYINFESKHVARDGRAFPVEITANYVEYDGKAYGFAFVRDITERKQAEGALRESEEKFRVLVETMKAGISLYRGDKSIYVKRLATSP